ncbi:OLC1v1032857C1 [Oldenlandia corymbosa var. corymbosa]|uniref:OLC1v1032857C1 n=1 Tax=Oldenlandia corymbosa var. corymbosa TaxID=529605 RepID=A0AAV1CPY8_OLDCO|nr:OLC1v1032857C1 [Oldenlandia corymbosa var. corymbosa]
MPLCRFLPSWISTIIACMGGCLGCCAKPPLIISVDEPNKGLKIQGQRVKKASVTEDFWSSSTCEMDNNSTFPSQRSVSSISTSTQTLDPNSSSGSMCQSSEFVNHGLLLWNQTRQQWIKDKESKTKPKETQDAKLCWNATYESLLGSNKPFPQPIPLPEMVDFLVDIWEQEGLYD